jgi:hypothetical protein
VKAGDDQILQRVVDSIDVPAYVQNSRLDLITANRIGWKLFPHAERHSARSSSAPFNLMRFQVLDPSAQDFYLDWELAVRSGTALLREAAGRDRADESLFTLIGELSAKSQFFRTLWASHDVLRHRRGRKRFHHPLVGDLSFESQSFTVDEADGHNLVVYTVEPNSSTADALRILATWTTDSSEVSDLLADSAD